MYINLEENYDTYTLTYKMCIRKKYVQIQKKVNMYIYIYKYLCTCVPLSASQTIRNKKAVENQKNGWGYCKCEN